MLNCPPPLIYSTYSYTYSTCFLDQTWPALNISLVSASVTHQSPVPDYDSCLLFPDPASTFSSYSALFASNKDWVSPDLVVQLLGPFHTHDITHIS